MNITPLGGVNEIGGNKILIEHKGTRIFLDFGMSFGQAGKYFSEFLNPRKCVALTDFFEFGLLPDISGIYRNDYLKHMGRSEEEKELDAVFLSHAHADHAQYIHFLKREIPVFCTKESKIILKSLEVTGSNTFSDLVTCCDAFTFYTNTKGSESRVTRKTKDYVNDREFVTMVEGKTVEVGSLKVEMIPTDHSLPGACAFIVRSDEGVIVYTGDIRFHGSNQDKSRKFVEMAASVSPEWLICEGTRIDKDAVDSEDGVRKSITKLVSQAKDLVLVEHPIRDLDRVNTIFQSAKDNNRMFAVSLKLAYLIQELGDSCPFSLDDVAVIVPKKSWGLIGRENVEQKHIEQDYTVWEREFISHETSITCEELKNNPNKYVVSMSFWDINQLVDIKPKGATWIKSSCEPFCEEMELDEERKRNWLKHFGIKEHLAHASGHASGKEIEAMVKKINPKVVFPVHTEHPALFKKFDGFQGKVLIPKLGQKYNMKHIEN